MQDLFKKFIYTGVGFVSVTAETLKNTVDKLVDDSKLSTDEGKKIVDDFMKNTESKRDEFESQLTKLIEKVTANFKFVTSGDLQEVVKRVEVLENKDNSNEKAKKAAVKA
jgi:polyhydroxyalkanoate synthesis regulator phasin